jgi:ferredoxin
MANLSDKLPDNAPGKFYVDGECIDCDQCREAAPTLFGRNADTCKSFIQRQPTTPQDLELLQEVMNSCPTQAIGDDGA